MEKVARGNKSDRPDFVLNVPCRTNDDEDWPKEKETRKHTDAVGEGDDKGERVEQSSVMKRRIKDFTEVKKIQ